VSAVSAIRVRPEAPADAAEIGRLHDAAFVDPQVAELVVAIRASRWYLPELALVAELWPVADLPDHVLAPIVGHVIVSGTELVAGFGETVPILMLSPLGVRPDHQRAGIGIALSRAVIELADARPEPLMIVQGHPGYYPRFGFVRGRTIGVLPPEHLGAIDKAWMVRRRPEAPDVRGTVVYPAAFLALD
jgi:putative acetyltransferase